jgi:hypothetical protein
MPRPKPHDPTLYYKKHLSPLLGCRVTAMVIDTDDLDDAPYMGYRLLDEKTGKIYQLVALSDPEGNGPGHLSIHDITDSPEERT